MSDKKKKQLGMNPSTAQSRLVKDILWSLVVRTEQNYCYRCHESMTRETFSIEHKKAWLDSENPIGLFFELDNIAFSHLSCNSTYSRKSNGKGPTKCGSINSYTQGCRCRLCKKVYSDYYKERRKLRKEGLYD